MTIELDLKPEVEAKIKAQAQERGLSVEAFIASVIEGLNYGHKDEGEDPRIAAMQEAVNDELFMADLALEGDDDEFIQALESMAADVPALPRDFSREDIYFPRD
jgi:hypothetical protein